MMDARHRLIAQRISDPFDTVCLSQFMPNDAYQQLLNEFPSPYLSEDFPDPGRKRNINETHKELGRILKESRAWSKFYSWVSYRGVGGFIDLALTSFGMDVDSYSVTGTKFEFSFLPGNGGCVYPHPDTPRKIITGVFYFPDPEWKPEYGGEFEMYRYIGKKQINDFNYWRERHWDNVEIAARFPFVPNTCVLMRKNNVSLHGVSPCLAPVGMWRTSVTANIIANKKT